MTFLGVFRELDWVLFGAVLLLVLLGLSMLVSATYTQGLISPLFIRQAAAAGIGLIVCLAVARLPYHFWRRYALGIYVVGMSTLVVVIVIGDVIRGTISRLDFFGFQVQPSEFMKVALVLFLAWLLSRYKIIRWRQVAISGLFVALPVLLVMREPDVGVAALMLITWIGIVIFKGLPLRHVVIMLLIGMLLAFAAWQWWLLDYQQERIRTFLDPGIDPLQSGYSVTQSIIALGSGQLVGRGLGHGPQSQLKFLPERHTDFIMASIGEELGFVGVMLALILYVVILWRLLLIATVTQDSFGRLISVGVFFVLLLGLVVSAGMNMGLLPVTGIPLPLISYGGSSLVATFLLIGLVESVWVYSRFVQAPPPEISSVT
jgi:rod shape determining protein RodA